MTTQRPSESANPVPVPELPVQPRSFKPADLIFVDRLVLPLSDRQFRISTSQDPDTFMATLVGTTKPKVSLVDSVPVQSCLLKAPFKITVKDYTFRLTRTAGFLEGFVRPVVKGFVEPKEGGSSVSITTGLTDWAEGTVNAPVWALLGALAGFAISSYLLPHPMLLVYSLVATVAIPALISALTIAVTRKTCRQDLPDAVAYLQQLAHTNDLQAIEGEHWSQLPPRPIFSESVVAGLVSSILFLAVAFGLHALAWDFWVKGKYQESARLCEPVRALAEAALSSDNVTTSDCQYYLAECYRCLGRLSEAEKLYEDAITGMSKTLGDSNNFYADAVFNLGRVYESQGHPDKAEVQYKKALEIWGRSKEIGPRNMVYAKGLNRLSVAQLKQKHLQEAWDTQSKALEIDRAYGGNGLASVNQDRNDLAAIAIANGDYETADSLLMPTIRRKVERYGEQDLSLLPTYINLVKLLQQADRRDEATKAYEFAADILTANGLMPPNTDKELTPEEMSKIYGKATHTLQQRYEVPNVHTRADITFTADGYE